MCFTFLPPQHYGFSPAPPSYVPDATSQNEASVLVGAAGTSPPLQPPPQAVPNPPPRLPAAWIEVVRSSGPGPIPFSPKGIHQRFYKQEYLGGKSFLTVGKGGRYPALR